MSFKLDLTPLKRLLSKLQSRPLPDDVAKKWAVRYSSFVRKRFKNEGNGEWKKLSPATLKRRRGKGSGAKILRDTGILFAALSVGAKGNLTQPIKKGVRFGFSNVKHPGSGRTIRQIAIFHETGAGKNPKRQILVEPDVAVMKYFQKTLKESIEQRGVKHRGS